MTQDPAKLNDRINAIFQQLFQADLQSLGDNARRGALQRWDSLGHLELQAALEKEFQIVFPVDDVLNMETIADVRRTVAKLCAMKIAPQ